MLRLLNIIWMFLSISLLSACAPTQHYQYVPPQNKQALKCISQCKVATNSCTQICALKNSTCRREMQANATERYTAYKQRCMTQGTPITKSYENILRTAGCEHSCNCIPSYNTCYRACGGTVY